MLKSNIDISNFSTNLPLILRLRTSSLVKISFSSAVKVTLVKSLVLFSTNIYSLFSSATIKTFLRLGLSTIPEIVFEYVVLLNSVFEELYITTVVNIFNQSVN